MTDPKMSIWNAVQTTDPAHTKKVEFGRKFTSIDAMWQIKRMTEQFGPVGQGWGHRTVHSIETFPAVAIAAVADVTIWWFDPGKGEKSFGPIRGCAPFVEFDGAGAPNKNNKGKPIFDDDAPKKAMTDALTKGLSHLGLSADVFLGLFDDVKYVQRVTRDLAVVAAAAAPLPLAVETIKRLIAEATSPEALDTVAANARAGAKDIEPAHLGLIALWFKERRLALTAPISVAAE